MKKQKKLINLTEPKSKHKKFDKERFIERILVSGDWKQVKAVATLLEEHGFTVKQVLEDIKADRERKGLLQWT